MSRVPLPRSGWDKENVDFVRALENLGWEFTPIGKGAGVSGRAPDGTDFVSLHARSGNRKKYEALIRKWQKKAMEVSDATPKFVAVAGALTDPDVGAVDPIVDAVLLKATDKHLAAQARDIAAAVQTSERTVVSERPWLSRMGSNRAKATTKLVESDRVTEVTYSDGSMEWRCCFPGCDYSTDRSGRSASHHFGQAHTKKGLAEPRVAAGRVPVAVDVPIDVATMRTSPHYDPSERLHRALTSFLGEAGTSDIAALAYAALQWFHTRPDLEPAEEKPHRDLTPEELLDRVRLLVGGRDVALEAAHEALLAETATLRTEVERLKGSLSGLAALAAEEVAQH